jgi:hypothetical protein
MRTVLAEVISYNDLTIDSVKTARKILSYSTLLFLILLQLDFFNKKDIFIIYFEKILIFYLLFLLYLIYICSEINQV